MCGWYQCKGSLDRRTTTDLPSTQATPGGTACVLCDTRWRPAGCQLCLCVCVCVCDHPSSPPRLREQPGVRTTPQFWEPWNLAVPFSRYPRRSTFFCDLGLGRVTSPPVVRDPCCPLGGPVRASHQPNALSGHPRAPGHLGHSEGQTQASCDSKGHGQSHGAVPHRFTCCAVTVP